MQDIQKFRAWAEEQIALLTRQRDAVDRKIAEFQGFLSVLGQGEDLMNNRLGLFSDGAVVIPSNGNGNGHESFPARIAGILRSARGPMNAAAILGNLELQGYEYNGRSPLKVIVATELARQSKKRGHGIRKVGAGMYTAD